VILLQLAEHESQQVRTAALDALDRAICGTLASPQYQETVHRAGAGKDLNDEDNGGLQHVQGSDTIIGNGASSVSISKQGNIPLECTLLQPLCTLYNHGRITDVRAGALRILLHVLEVSPICRFTEKCVVLEVSRLCSYFFISLYTCMFICLQICTCNG